jgi:hypothetical protein
MKMAVLSIVLLCTSAVLAQSISDMPLEASGIDGVGRAQQDIQRLRDLVAAGALAPSRLQDAEQAMGDAQDDAILSRTLYGKLNAQELTEQQALDMIAAATRRLNRQSEKLARMQKLVDAGVLARGELATTEQEMESRRLALDLANARARLINEIAEMARREQAAEAAAMSQVDQHAIEHFGGDAAFSSKQLAAVQLAFEKKFSRALPISANGETSVHRALGFDHRGRVDVALSPDQKEGVWLRAYLANKAIPYFAFRTAVPGRATGAHIHIGPGSTRLRAAD